MPKESSNILQYNQGEKSLWMPFIIYASTESLLEKIPEKSSTTQITQHTPWGFSFSQTSFGSNKNKHSFYRGADCMKKICANLRNHFRKNKKKQEKK